MKLGTLALIFPFAAMAAFAQEHEHGRAPPGGVVSAKPGMASEPAPAGPTGASRKDAEGFVAKVERELPIDNEYGNRVAWIAANFITPDTDWLSAKITAELAAAAVE